MIADNLKHLRAKDSHSSIQAVLYLSAENIERVQTVREDAMSMEGGSQMIKKYIAKMDRDGSAALAMLSEYTTFLPIFLLFCSIVPQFCPRKGLDWRRR